MEEKKKKCPRCGAEMVLVNSNTGGFTSHLFVHLAPPRYECQNKKCGYKEELCTTEPEDMVVGDKGGRT